MRPGGKNYIQTQDHNCLNLQILEIIHDFIQVTPTEKKNKTKTYLLLIYFSLYIERYKKIEILNNKLLLSIKKIMTFTINQLIFGSIIFMIIYVYIWIQQIIVYYNFNKEQITILQECAHFGPPPGCKWEDGPYSPKAQIERNANLAKRNQEIHEYNIKFEHEMKNHLKK